MKARTIFLVDDEEAILSSLSRALEKKGFIVATAGSGERAVGYLRHNRCDLVITDLIMGNVNGLEVLRKAREFHPDISVILLTGYGDVASAVEAMQLGADDYLQKPFDFDELLRRIGRALERRNLVTRLHRPNDHLGTEVDARKQAEIERQQSQDGLEFQVSERKVELRDSGEDVKKIMETLISREQELREKNKELEELNSTLRTVLRCWEVEHAEARKEITTKMVENVLPLLKKALNDASGPTRGYLESAYANLLDFNAQDTPNNGQLSANLSPRELQIVHLIRQDKTSKEIASYLGLSIRTIEFYRENIRKKFNISGQPKNLKKFLLSIP